MALSIPPSITASMLYNFVQCPHRLFLDRFGNPAQKETVNPFVKLLWEKGTRHEKAVIRDLKLPFVDLSSRSSADRSRLTMAAIDRGEPLI